MSIPAVGVLANAVHQVRRDLRDVAPRTLEHDYSEPEDQNNTYENRLPISTAEILRKKNITDEGPIYRMMQHYVPYFDHYKNSIYGDQTSASSAHSKSLATVLLAATFALFFCF